MNTTGFELRRFSDVGAVWETLIEIYAEVRADRLHDPHYSIERCGERLARHAAEPGWEVVVEYDRGEAVGYIYALMVNLRAGEGKVHRLYETWGYKDVGQSQPSPDSPDLMVMLRPR
ncbi:hypothetical protein NX801_26830 [Streptomyces sp. LP05-1]|uniref:Acetyltransferase n=1 Tax=Streptomyces pyxinae TaxID=2970734 RepID=A0ABT2CP24_9ACTN|nr:hypothetical protein [Streptomyces sp. LP05-1]MCS0639192.1 hypothetical protein [Streptomyces sp. LP05-1]